MITPSRLLKSCAMPPVSCPSAFIFSDWRSISSARSRSAVSLFNSRSVNLELTAGRAQFRLGAFPLRDLMFFVPVELGKFPDSFLEVVRHLIE